MPLSSASLQTWNRLEPRPRSNTFTRSVRAEVRDALWMITRQWQLGELNGEDTGTATFARLDMQTSRINRIAKKDGPYVPIDETMPLECLVEREPINPDLMHRIELGRQFLKMLPTQLSAFSGSIAAFTAAVRALPQLNFSASTTVNILEPELYSSPELWQATLAVGSGRAIDGFKIISYLKTTVNPLSVLVSITSPPSGFNTAINALGVAFVNWYNKVYSQPGSSTEDYWLQKHLEYQFVCSAPLNATDYTMLTAKEYYSGNLDWYSFDIQDTYTATSVTSGTPNVSVMDNKPFTVIPSKINFGGMPAARFWEMEDRRVDFGNMSASTTDTAQLLVSEFATIYSNDWTLLPYTVPTGTICNLRKILVTDVFGQTTYIKAASSNDWTMFTLSTNEQSLGDKRLFIPPVVANMEESEPIETANLMRDEMANMVWGVETVVSNGVNGGQNGKEAEQRLKALLEANTTSTPPSTLVNKAEIKYNLMTHVPENWIPFVPVNVNDPLESRQIQFQRAAMPRQVLNNAPSGRVRPRTTLLQADSAPIAPATTWNSSYIYEEEVPRSGAILIMTWQRARWQSGQVALWLGRRKQNGRGEGNSGLRFDYLTAK